MPAYLPRILAFAGIFLAAPIAIVVWLIFVVHDDTTTTRYASAAEARATGAFGRGWLPRAMPYSAYDIEEWDNLDTKTGGGTFRVAAPNAEAFRARLRSATAADIALIDAADLANQAYNFRTDEDFILAVKWQTGEARFSLTVQE